MVRRFLTLCTRLLPSTRNSVSRAPFLIPTIRTVSRTYNLIEIQSRHNSTPRMACQNLQDMPEEQQKAFADGIDWLMFDCDGCIWDEKGKAYEGAVEALHTLESLGKKVFYVTNNSSHTRAEIAAKCQRNGFTATDDQIISAAWLTANYLKQVLKFEGKVYLIGSQALQAECTLAGINYECVKEEYYPDQTSYYSHALLDPEVKAVVVGYDPYINYMKVVKASSYAQREGCIFLATNMDSYLPTSTEVRIPGTGSIVSFVKFAAEKEPIVVGKPSTAARDILALDPRFDPKRALMVGDRLDTDVKFGNNCGFQSMLVLTGSHNLDDVRRVEASNSIEDQKMIPGTYLDTVGQLASIFKK